MRSAARMRLDHAISKLATVAAALVATAAGVSAQDFGEVRADDARECAGIASDALRLACYDRVFRGAPAGARASSLAASAVSGAAGESLRNDTANAVAESSGSDAASPASPATGPARTPSEVRSVAIQPALADSLPESRAAARAAAASEPQSMPIVVVEMRARQGNRIFTTQTGEVWVQTDSRRTYLPDPPFPATIEPGALSSFFLVPTDRGGSVRVRRAQ